MSPCDYIYFARRWSFSFPRNLNENRIRAYVIAYGLPIALNGEQSRI